MVKSERKVRHLNESVLEASSAGWGSPTIFPPSVIQVRAIKILGRENMGLRQLRNEGSGFDGRPPVDACYGRIC
ncbi:hypothetical protein T265_05803 [Opisthorchis viverrini]|uniref:Uncharacterized protein n=1 Tax=Opisthorchis viverrini TaxID=6198 RepID=A0A075AEW0_OPIVI|nr:hypothetical protein T265_05803 [Opisthorchis viverrini]KER27114.1 hypothetical protein T265_05803 [Opisthorchis viverrini]